MYVRVDDRTSDVMASSVMFLCLRMHVRRWRLLFTRSGLEPFQQPNSLRDPWVPMGPREPGGFLCQHGGPLGFLSSFTTRV